MITTVRTATADDAALLHELAAATFGLACPPDTLQTSIDDFIGRHLSQLRFADYLADPDRVLLIAEVDGEPAGYAMLVAGEPADSDVVAAITLRPTIELSKCYVLATHHGTGASTALMEASIATSRGRGAVGMWLGVNQQNTRANRFYEKSGFTMIGTKRFLVGERWEDDFVRERAL